MSRTLLTRPAYRPYAARVIEARRLAPHLVRITFSGDGFEHFGDAGLDQRIKLVLPHADGTIAELGQHDEEISDAGSWYAVWRELPAAERNPFRTYTVRRADPSRREVEVDFVVHPGPGPAGAWAESAAPGDEVVIVGPDSRSPDHRQGIDWHPGTARRVLLAGDETAAPAISGILESLDAGWEADAFIEVAHADDILDVRTAASVRLSWVVRGDRPHGAALVEAVTEWTDASPSLLARAAAPRVQELADIDVDLELLWDSPADGDGEFYAWMAGESGVVKTLRRHLVTGCGVDRRRVAFMGYWRVGQSERIG